MTSEELLKLFRRYSLHYIRTVADEIESSSNRRDTIQNHFTSELADVISMNRDHYRGHLIQLTIRGINQNLPLTYILEEMETYRNEFIDALNMEDGLIDSLVFDEAVFKTDHRTKLKMVTEYMGKRALIDVLEKVIRKDYPLVLGEGSVTQKLPGFVFTEKPQAPKQNTGQVKSLLEAKEKPRRLDYPQEMNAQEAAEFLDTTIKNLYQLTSSRSVPHYKRGRKLMFKKAELQNWRLEKVSSSGELKGQAADRAIRKKK